MNSNSFTLEKNFPHKPLELGYNSVGLMRIQPKIPISWEERFVTDYKPLCHPLVVGFTIRP